MFFKNANKLKMIKHSMVQRMTLVVKSVFLPQTFLAAMINYVGVPKWNTDINVFFFCFPNNLAAMNTGNMFLSTYM